MGRTPRRVSSILLTSFLVLALASPASAAITDGERARRAAGYLATQQRANGSFPAFSPIGSTADAVLAFVAAGVGRRQIARALTFLEDRVIAGKVTDPGLQAKVVLAWAAAGRGPRTIGGQNLVRALSTAWSQGSVDTVYETALMVLALKAARAGIPVAAIVSLEGERCADGGWAYDGSNPGEDEHCQGDPGTDFYASDTNTTALAVMALDGIGSGPATAPTPFDFFASMRDATHGGWGYTWAYPTTDANSTGLVLQAYAAEGLAAPGIARQALRNLQYPRCGAFAYSFTGGVKTAPDLGATIGAVPGLLGKAFPYTRVVELAAPVTPACP